MNLAQLLIKAARTHGRRPAISRGGEMVLTYGQLLRNIAVMAGNLRARHRLQPGDRVALVMTNCAEYMQALFAAWFAGLGAVPIDARLHPRELAWILDHSGVKLAFVTPDLAATVAPLANEVKSLAAVIATESPDFAALTQGEPVTQCERVNPNDLAWLFYTSGATGRPKGAMLSHRNLLAMTMNYLADIDPISERDCIIHAAPMSHGSGLYGLPHLAKAANQVIPASGGFNPGETLELIARWPGASCFFAPTMVNRLVDCDAVNNADTGNLKTLVYGGGPMYLADIRHALAILGPRLVQIYGQGEAPMTITVLPKSMHVESEDPNYLERLASVGIARTNVEVRVVNAFDEPLHAGEIGEVVCRSDVVMAGYWRDLQASADMLRGGWLHTGDVGSFDERGFLTLKDRSKDVIISGGSNIYPRDIEEALLAHPEVAEASVVGRRDPKWGEAVVAFVVARPGVTLTPEGLDKTCLERIARFKRPSEYRFVESLPKNSYGKVLKTELRAQLAAPVAASG
ncbi:MAG: AMP-binding protein [Betaproteobacteria bacterium]|nr:AMP-binding protein [Betaproteobacteria bacterium]